MGEKGILEERKSTVLDQPQKPGCSWQSQQKQQQKNIRTTVYVGKAKVLTRLQNVTYKTSFSKHK